MDFCFHKVSRPVVAAGAFALFMGLSTPASMMAKQAAPAAAGQQPATRNYKDKDEYDLFLKITQTQDAKVRLQLLNTWQDKYPTSDYSPERLQYFIATLQQLAPTDPTQRQPLITKCQELLKTDPTNFKANYLVSLWAPVVGGTSCSPDMESAVETSAKAAIDGADASFSDKNKPAQVSQPDWEKAKTQSVATAHNALAWDATCKKDVPTAETEYRASLTANPDQGIISVQLGKLLVESKDTKQIPEGLFEYARAGEYSGPGPAVAPDARTKLLTYFNTAYKDFHGSTDGAQAILDQAKTAALPPTGFMVTNAQDKANADAAKLQQRIDSEPAFKIWYAIESQLTGDQGSSYFTKEVQGNEIPGGSDTSKYFSGTVISADPSKVVVGVQDPAVPDATLSFTTPLKDAEAAKIKVGDKLQFTGVADSFVKEPYMLMFKDPTIPGVETSAPAKTGRKKR